MPAEVKLQAYQERAYAGRLRQIFPSADRAKSIVEVRVSILNPDANVKPEMTASVTFQEPGRSVDAAGTDPGRRRDGPAPEEGRTRDGRRAQSVVLVPKRTISVQSGEPTVWIVTNGTATRRKVTLGADRIDQVEVRSGVAPGEALIVNAPAGLTDGARVRVKGS
jgi:multidrug efflux pump subunit AcrA (membrane-fusion protein)